MESPLPGLLLIFAPPLVNGIEKFYLWAPWQTSTSTYNNLDKLNDIVKDPLEGKETNRRNCKRGQRASKQIISQPCLVFNCLPAWIKGKGVPIHSLIGFLWIALAIMELCRQDGLLTEIHVTLLGLKNTWDTHFLLLIYSLFWT